MHCLIPPLSKVPRGLWVCPQCTDAGVSAETVKTARQIQLEKYKRNADAPAAEPPLAAVKPARAASPVRASTRIAQLVPSPPLPTLKRGPGRPRKHPLPTAVSALSRFDFGTTEGAERALGCLMPGAWDSMHVSLVSNHAMSGSLSSQQHASIRCDVLQSEIETLLATVEFSFSPSLVCMTDGDGQLAKLFRGPFYKHGFAVVSNSVSPEAVVDYHFDAMQPDSYQRLRFEVGSHVIVVTPLFELADVIIPLAVKYAKHVACCRVPCQFLNERRQYPARDAWLK